MEDLKTAFVQGIMAELYGRGLQTETLRTVNEIIMRRLENIDIVKRETALANIDDTDDQLMKLFAATKKIEGASDKTVERYLYIIRRIIRMTNVPIRKMTVFVLRRYLANKEMDGSSINTIAGERAIMRSFFGWLFKQGLIDNNPADKLGVIKTHKRIELPFSATEMEMIRCACETKRDRAIVEFLRSTGCRIDEVCRLNAEEIDFRTKSVKVLGKGSKERIVYIDETCALHLDDYLRNRERESKALFDGRATERITPGGVRAALKRIEEGSGVENVHPHRFRRTLATNMIRRGMRVQDVAQILGHADINTTMIYVSSDDRAVEIEYRKFSV